jgi:hypothetical protein
MTNNSDKEHEQRLQKILRGAFSGPPTPLKEIPTKSGDARKLERNSTPSVPPAQKPRRLKPKVRLHQIDDR